MFIYPCFESRIRSGFFILTLFNISELHFYANVFARVCILNYLCFNKRKLNRNKTKNMNTYVKYCPNVFVAKCDASHEKGDIIELETKYGQTHECIVHNLIFSKDGFYYYSITRADGFNSQERAKRKAERRANWSANALKRSDKWREASNEGADFLKLAEPIKIGHHSEKRHRALIQRNWNRMANSVKEEKKAEAHAAKIEYWERKSTIIDLSMPESVEYFEYKLKKAIEKHELLKAKPELREHSYSLTYAKKERNELEDKVKTAKKLWS